MPNTRTPQRNAASNRARGGDTSATAMSIPSTVPHRALVQALATRLRNAPDSPDLPLVSINRISPTRSVHILVVWDKWDELTIPQRGRIIADAFAAAFPNDPSVVRLPMGLTPGEAFSQAHLRYEIVPLVRPSDKVTNKQVKDALASAGGVLMRIGDDQRVRFATRASRKCLPAIDGKD